MDSSAYKVAMDRVREDAKLNEWVSKLKLTTPAFTIEYGYRGHEMNWPANHRWRVVCKNEMIELPYGFHNAMASIAKALGD